MIEIRSYRAVFDLERRIYRVDQLRLNPGGIPVRGVVYFLAILLAMLIAGGLPLVGAAIGALPWYLRDLALPVASATVLSVIRIEGRPFHLAAYALLRYRAGSRRLAGVRPCGGPGYGQTDTHADSGYRNQHDADRLQRHDDRERQHHQQHANVDDVALLHGAIPPAGVDGFFWSRCSSSDASLIFS